MFINCSFRVPAFLFTLTVSVLVSFAASPAFGQDADVRAGVEYFSWREYGVCPQVLEERGPRFFIGLDKTNRAIGSWETNLQGKVYAAVVQYNGFDQSCIPLSTATGYLGVTGEAAATRWLFSGSRNKERQFGAKFGVGLDSWRRSILATNGYSEDYVIGFARLGLAAKQGNKWTAEAGIKYPFATYEIARLTGVGFSSDPELNPKGQYSYFASIEFKNSKDSLLRIYYDSYRFGASDSVPVSACPSTPCLVHQPTSHQDTIGFSFSLQN